MPKFISFDIQHKKVRVKNNARFIDPSYYWSDDSLPFTFNLATDEQMMLLMDSLGQLDPNWVESRNGITYQLGGF